MERCPNCKRTQPRSDAGLHVWEPVTIRGAAVAVCSSCASNLFAHAGQAKVLATAPEPDIADRAFVVRKLDSEPYDPPRPVVTIKPPVPTRGCDARLRYFRESYLARYCGSLQGRDVYLLDTSTRGRWLVRRRKPDVAQAERVFYPGQVSERVQLISAIHWADNDAATTAKQWIAELCKDAAAGMRARGFHVQRRYIVEWCEHVAAKLAVPVASVPSIADQVRALPSSGNEQPIRTRNPEPLQDR